MRSESITLAQAKQRGLIDDCNGPDCYKRHKSNVILYRGAGLYSRMDNGKFTRRKIATFCRIKLK